jgi:hypothetical protein
VSGNEGAEYHLKCPDCSARFVYFYHGGLMFWVHKEDKQKLDKYAAEIRELKSKAGKLIVERYEQVLVEYVRNLPNRTAKKAVLNAGRGFLKDAVDPSYVEAKTREAIRKTPERCFEQLKAHDTDIEALFETVLRFKKEESELQKSMEKIGIPEKRLGFTVFGQ